MSFSELVAQYRQQFTQNGSFELRSGQQMRLRCVEEQVPELPGVYLIYGRRQSETELLYIGKAGTLRKDGTFKDQKLRGRLNNKQQGMPRQEFFEQQMHAVGLDALAFTWFVTFDSRSRIIPAKAEADLLQVYFAETGQLPEWNDCV